MTTITKTKPIFASNTNTKTPLIISASRRTDILAFYAEWFFHRLNEGFVFVKNPFNPTQIRRISLHPSDVACIVWWTRNPKSILKKLILLQSYQYYFLITVNNYGKCLEPHAPSLKEIVPLIEHLKSFVGSERIIWRYDPIIFTDKFDFNYHYENFEKIATTMKGLTKRCIISFFQPYKKSIKNLLPIMPHLPSNHDKLQMISIFAQIASKHDISLQWCAPDEGITEIDCAKRGIIRAGCIDSKLVEKLSGIQNWKKDLGQRKNCLCAQSVDIGTYNTCAHGCRYCYATTNHVHAQRFFQRFNQKAEILQ